MKWWSLFCCLLLVDMASVYGEEFHRFVIVTPSYNNKKWYRKNLSSLLDQRYPCFRVIYIDDASPDGTGNYVAGYLKRKDTRKQVTLVRNATRRGQLANVYRAIYSCDDDEIIVIVDGDDWFLCSDALQTINKAYHQDHEVWMTYGQFKRYAPGKMGINGTIGFARPVADAIVQENKFRRTAWLYTHVRTFKAWLFKQIKLRDLLNNGYFFEAATDLAAMFPMLEMAGDRHVCIKKPLYAYNIKTTLKTKVDLQRALEKKIRSAQVYERLTGVVHQEDIAVDVLLNEGQNSDHAFTWTHTIDAIRSVQRCKKQEIPVKLKELQSGGVPYIIMLSSKRDYTADDIKKCLRFMQISRADVCYLDAQKKDIHDKPLLPNFFRVGEPVSSDKVITREFAHVLGRSGDEDPYENADTFYYIKPEGLS